jgi:hypothetical protein
MKKCKIEGCENPIWGKGVCKHHTPSSPLRKSSSLKKTPPKRHKRELTTEEKEKQTEDIKKMIVLFKSLYIKRGKKSEISGTFIPLSSLKLCCHHILPKSKYEEAKFDESNIVLLTPEEHGNVEINSYKYEEINRRRKILLKKYNLL